jgi:hypothetical protein
MLTAGIEPFGAIDPLAASSSSPASDPCCTKVIEDDFQTSVKQ